MLDNKDKFLVSEVLKLGNRLARSLAKTSRHTVVSGIRTESGHVYFGVNCDGIHGTCAEIVAYANAVLASDMQVQAVVAMTIAKTGGRIVPPCGNCRQIFSEVAPDCSVIVEECGELMRHRISKLLPHPYAHAHAEETVNEFVFVGRHDISIGRCGCMELPEDWRESLVGKSGKLYIRQDRDERCLCIIPAETMEKQLAMYREKATKDSSIEKALQILGENTQQLDVEDGKIRIDRRLLKGVGIKGRAVLIGAIRMIMLYNPEEVNKHEEGLCLDGTYFDW